MCSKMKDAYVVMHQARALDEFICDELWGQGKTVFHYHPGIGQEALSAGVPICLKREDYFFYTHRGTAGLLAKGVSLRDVIYDLFFRNGEDKAGTNRGCGSKMHAYAPECGIVGRNGVFGTRFPFSAGLAYASLLRNDGKVALCAYGEAEGARGQYFETLNMAVLLKLPVVYVAEHNGFSVDSRTESIYAGGSMVNFWRGFDIPVKQFDGNNLEETIAVVSEAVERARRGEGPSVLEGITYRVTPHSPLDKNSLVYRTQEEIDQWKAKDPLEQTKRVLLANGELTEEEDAALCAKCYRDVRDIYAEAMTTPELDPQVEMYRGVYYSVPVDALKG